MRWIYLGFLIAGLAVGGCGGSGSQQTWYEECTAKGGKVYLSKGHAVCSDGSRIIDIRRQNLAIERTLSSSGVSFAASDTGIPWPLCQKRPHGGVCH